MAEYIDREKIISKTCSNCTRQIDLACQYEKPCERLIAAFLNEDPEDVATVVRSQWIDTGEKDEDGNVWFVCKECGHKDLHAPLMEVPHCWYCGARMDGTEVTDEVQK